MLGSFFMRHALMWAVVDFMLSGCLSALFLSSLVEICQIWLKHSRKQIVDGLRLKVKVYMYKNKTQYLICPSYPINPCI